jgi:hypothetical protein
MNVAGGGGRDLEVALPKTVGKLFGLFILHSTLIDKV